MQCSNILEYPLTKFNERGIERGVLVGGVWGQYNDCLVALDYKQALT